MEAEQDRLLEALYDQCYRDLLSYAQTCLGNPDLAEDMVQDTFHEATNQVDCLLEHPYPDRWLIKTLKEIPGGVSGFDGNSFGGICGTAGNGKGGTASFSAAAQSVGRRGSLFSCGCHVKKLFSCPVGREIRPDGMGQRQAFVPNSTKIAG